MKSINMDNKTKGAWVIHHARKLQVVADTDFDQLSFAGKCGLMLSAIAADSQRQIKLSKIEGLAKANLISPRSELKSILNELERQKLVEQSSENIEILGLTTQAVLEHTSTIFEETSPTPEESVIINISELASQNPIIENEVIEQTGDTCKLLEKDAVALVKKSELIGFFDAETDNYQQRFIFNGNLFRAEDIKKINAVLATLNSSEKQLISEFNEKLFKEGCIALDKAYAILPEILFKKLQSIGFYDVNTISNETGNYYFVTRPAAFSKFTKSFTDDALDLAKAFVSSLTYGMTESSRGRGKIQMITALMNKLINGEPVGPATAIGQDYRALEMRGVIEVQHEKNSMYSMRLLKPEVGKLALSVIKEGDVTTEVFGNLPKAAISNYLEPEFNRTFVRKNLTPSLQKSVGEMISKIRTGGLNK